MNCPKCDTVLPDDALFCIECGTPIAQAATGPTQRIQSVGDGPRCPACQTVNPAGADFCVHCGRVLNAAAPTIDAPLQTDSPVFPPLVINEPLATIPVPAPIASSAPMGRKERRRARKRLRKKADDIAGGIFLIGLAVLFFTHAFWPGILVLIGIVGMISSLARGRVADGMQALFWPIGLAILFSTGSFWPGILVLIGISAVLGKFGRSW